MHTLYIRILKQVHRAWAVYELVNLAARRLTSQYAYSITFTVFIL